MTIPSNSPGEEEFWYFTLFTTRWWVYQFVDPFATTGNIRLEPYKAYFYYYTILRISPIWPATIPIKSVTFQIWSIELLVVNFSPKNVDYKSTISYRSIWSYFSIYINYIRCNLMFQALRGPTPSLQNSLCARFRIENVQIVWNFVASLRRTSTTR